MNVFTLYIQKSKIRSLAYFNGSGATPWVNHAKTFASAESAIHKWDETGRWPATESNCTRSQGVALGWYEPGPWPENLKLTSKPF
jgi:hypothetical protein